MKQFFHFFSCLADIDPQAAASVLRPRLLRQHNACPLSRREQLRLPPYGPNGGRRYYIPGIAPPVVQRLDILAADIPEKEDAQYERNAFRDRESVPYVVYTAEKRQEVSCRQDDHELAHRTQSYQ